MIKILFIEGRYNSIYGAQKSMITLIENLPKNKFQPIVLTTKKGKLSNYLKEKNIEYKVIEASNRINQFGGKIPNENLFNKSKILFDLLKYNKQVYDLIKKEDIDLIYNNGFRGVVLSLIASKMAGKPSVYYKRIDGKANYLIRKLILKHHDIIFCISEGVKNGFENDELDKYNHKFKTLYTGYEFDEFSDEKLEISKEDNINIGLVGSVTPRKGYKEAIEAFKEIDKQKVRLNFYGSVSEGYEDYKKELDSMIDKYNLKDKVIWHGFVENVKEAYKNIDITILPSKSEGLPRVVIESLANGIPVVATDVGGVKEIITDEYLGYVAEDVSNIKDGIDMIIENEQYKNNNLRRREYVINKFSLKNYVDGFIDEIEKIL